MEGIGDIRKSDDPGSENDCGDVPDFQNITYEYTKKDLDSLKELWTEVFTDSQEFTDYYFDTICRDNKILAAYDGDVLVGMVHLNGYEVMVCGRATKCIFIVGIAVKRKYRNRGIMKSMIRKVSEDIKCGEDGFFLLLPSNKEFFGNIGFSEVYSTLTIECNIVMEDQVTERIERYYEINRLGVCNLTDYSEEDYVTIADKINEQLAMKYNIFSRRTPEYLKKMVTEHILQNGNVCIVKGESDKFVGLFSYEIYDGVMYAERIEIFDGNLNDMFTCIMKTAIDNACVGVISTLAESDYQMDASDIAGLDIQIREGHGIMALVPEDNNTLDIDKIKNHTFFDEII